MKLQTLLACCIIVLAFPTSSAEANVLEWVVAVVDGHPITNGELEESLNAVLLSSGEQLDASAKDALRKTILEKTIDDLLLFAEAENRQIYVSEREIDLMLAEEVRRIKMGYGGEEGYQNALERMGISEEGLESELRDGLLRDYLTNKLIQRQIISGIMITEKELTEFEEEHPEQHEALQQFRLSHILVRCAPDASEEDAESAFSRARALAMKARSGEDFASLASEYSEHESSGETGGDLGYARMGEIFPELEAKAFSLEIGDIDGPIRTKLGYHVILLTDKRDAKEYLISLKAKEKLEEYIKKLREKARIQMFEEETK